MHLQLPGTLGRDQLAQVQSGQQVGGVGERRRPRQNLGSESGPPAHRSQRPHRARQLARVSPERVSARVGQLGPHRALLGPREDGECVNESGRGRSDQGDHVRSEWQVLVRRLQ